MCLSVATCAISTRKSDKNFVDAQIQPGISVLKPNSNVRAAGWKTLVSRRKLKTAGFRPIMTATKWAGAWQGHRHNTQEYWHAGVGNQHAPLFRSEPSHARVGWAGNRPLWDIRIFQRISAVTPESHRLTRTLEQTGGNSYPELIE